MDRRVVELTQRTNERDGSDVDERKRPHYEQVAQLGDNPANYHGR